MSGAFCCSPFFKTASLTELRTHYTGYTRWPLSAWDLPVSAPFEILGLLMCITPLGFYVGTGHLNLGLHVFTESTLPTDPSPQSGLSFLEGRELINFFPFSYSNLDI